MVDLLIQVKRVLSAVQEQGTLVWSFSLSAQALIPHVDIFRFEICNLFLGDFCPGDEPTMDSEGTLQNCRRPRRAQNRAQRCLVSSQTVTALKRAGGGTYKVAPLFGWG